MKRSRYQLSDKVDGYWHVLDTSAPLGKASIRSDRSKSIAMGLVRFLRRQERAEAAKTKQKQED